MFATNCCKYLLEFIGMTLLKYFKELFKDKALIKKVITLAIPIMLQTLIVSSVNLVDNLMVGKLGDAAMSAVTSSNKYFNIVNFVVNSMVATCVIYIAQYNGAKNISKMQEAFRFSIISTSVIVVTCFLVVYLFPGQLISFIIKDSEIVSLGIRYLKIAAFSYLPLILSYPISGAMRSIGDSKTPMFISASSVVINGFLDYALIFGKFGLPKLNIEGAAVATVIARTIEAFLYVYIAKKGDYFFDTKIKEIFNYDSKLAKEIIIKALPLLINEVCFQFAETMYLKAYSYRGASVNAAFSVASTIADIFFILFSGMAIATTVLVGTPLGANKLKEGKDNAYKLICFSVIMAIIFGVMLYSSQGLAPIIFTSISDEAIDIAKHFLRVMGCFYWTYMFNCQCYFTLRAGGDTVSTMFMDSGLSWFLKIPLVFAFTYFTNVSIYTVYIIGQTTEFVKLAIAYHLVRKEKWVRNLAIEKTIDL